MCSLCWRPQASFTGTADDHTPCANPCDTWSQLCHGRIRWWLSATAGLHFREAAQKNHGLKGESATWHWRHPVLLEEWLKGSWFTEGGKRKCWRFTHFYLKMQCKKWHIWVTTFLFLYCSFKKKKFCVKIPTTQVVHHIRKMSEVKFISID